MSMKTYLRPVGNPRPDFGRDSTDHYSRSDISRLRFVLNDRRILDTAALEVHS